MPSLRSVLRFLVTGAVAAYVISLLVYLILRLIFGDGPWWLAIINNFAFWTFLPLIIAVPVALLLRRRWLIAVIAVPTLVAILWIGPYYLPKASTSPSGTTLRIVTFNMYKSNPRIGDVETWLRAQQADIVMLEEIPHSYAGSAITSLKDVYPYQVSQSVSVRTWGNMVLSRYPILSAENLDLFGNGIVPQLRVYLAVGSQKIVVYAVHIAQPIGQVQRIKLPFSGNADNPILRYDDTGRNAEIAALLASLQTETVPYIVAGDFNTSDQGVTYGTLAAQLTDTFREVGIGLGGSWPAAGEAGWPGYVPPLIRIDYIWHSAAFQTVEAHQGPKLGSDHLPLLATLELRQ